MRAHIFQRGALAHIFQCAHAHISARGATSRCSVRPSVPTRAKERNAHHPALLIDCASGVDAITPVRPPSPE